MWGAGAFTNPPSTSMPGAESAWGKLPRNCLKLLSKNQRGSPAPWLLEKVTFGDSAHRTMTFQGSKKRLKYSYKSILGTFKYFQWKGKMSFLVPLQGAASGLLQRNKREEARTHPGPSTCKKGASEAPNCDCL